MSEKKPKIYPKGVLVFPKHLNAPEFVVCNIIINPKDLFNWYNAEGKDALVDYKGEKQWNLQVTNWQGKMSCSVNTFQPDPNKAKSNSAYERPTPTSTPPTSKDEIDDLPF